MTGLLADDIRVPRYRTPPARRSKRAIHTQTARSRTHTGAHPEFGGNAVVPLLRRRPVSATRTAASIPPHSVQGRLRATAIAGNHAASTTRRAGCAKSS